MSEAGFFYLCIYYIFGNLEFTVEHITQRAEKVVSDSPGLVNFAIGRVNSVINLLDGQVKIFEKIKLQNNCGINLLMKTFGGLVKMMFGLVNVSYNLPEWQAVKMTFFAPCYLNNPIINICLIKSLLHVTDTGV